MSWAVSRNVVDDDITARSLCACRPSLFADCRHGCGIFAGRPSNTCYMAFKKVLEGLVKKGGSRVFFEVSP